MIIIVLSLFCLWTAYRIITFVEAYYRINKRGNAMDEKGRRACRSIKAHGITAYEFLMWYFTQDPNFISHYLWNAICIFCLRHVTPWMAKEVTEGDIVHYCLNTSTVIHLKKIRGSIYGLDLENIGWHCLPGSMENSFSLRIDIETPQMISFTFNDEKLEDPKQILAMLLMNHADCLHPMVHSFQNSLYESMKTAPPEYFRMYLHGNYLNESAHVFVPHPWLGFNGDTDWFEHILFDHSKRSIPFHSNFDKDLMKASPYLRFALQCRSIIFQELKRAGLDMIDPEAYFLCSVAHSIDHWQLGKLVEWVDFPDDMKYSPRYNYVSRNFFQHSQYWFLPNNYFRSHWHETRLYNRIYHRMKKVDPAYADIISLSISY